MASNQAFDANAGRHQKEGDKGALAANNHGNAGFDQVIHEMNKQPKAEVHVAKTSEANKVSDKTDTSADARLDARLTISNLFEGSKSVDAKGGQDDRDKLFAMIDESRNHYKSEGPHMDLLLTAMDPRDKAAQEAAKKILGSILSA